MAARLVIHKGSIEALANGSDAHALLQLLGDEIAADATEMAPKRTGAGAASIRAEVVEDAGRLTVRVSWDRDHFYMAFQELGTSQQSARPFLRPAAERRRRL